MTNPVRADKSWHGQNVTVILLKIFGKSLMWGVICG